MSLFESCGLTPYPSYNTYLHGSLSRTPENLLRNSVIPAMILSLDRSEESLTITLDCGPEVDPGLPARLKAEVEELLSSDDDQAPAPSSVRSEQTLRQEESCGVFSLLCLFSTVAYPHCAPVFTAFACAGCVGVKVLDYYGKLPERHRIEITIDWNLDVLANQRESICAKLNEYMSQSPYA